ncbi:MAG TPA: glycosyltransferase family 2 protein [Labilithrix sp.]|jgi:glycosyltransferase involved in cell wall biosynthesis|nr:glycosyltransferase family 2 protein [Labilithrix sp.]
MRLCAIVPTYENAATLAKVVREVRAHVDSVIVVDDGSGPDARSVTERLASEGLAIAVFREKNGGKGAAVKSGLARAAELGFTHALQIDADGQHRSADIPRFIDAARENPTALILGQPVFDRTAPFGRRVGRLVSVFWCAVETLSLRIGDPLCGFRVYPVDKALAVGARGDAMDFDPEIAVRLVWAGVLVVHVRTDVRYVPREEGGVSHYHFVRDTALISWMHTRMCLLGLLRLFGWRTRPRLT